VLVVLSLKAGVPREAVAGTVDEGYAPRPEWYFMWLFQLLTFFSGTTEVIGSLVIPGVLVLLLLALPLLDRRLPLTPASERPLALAAGIAAVTGIVYLTATGIGTSSDFGRSVALPDRPLNPNEQAGLRVFIREECASCHHIAGRGGRRVGPDLANMIAKGRTAEHLVRYIRKPDEVNRYARMPAFPLPAQELQDLAAFIRSLDFSKYPMKITPLPR
jgi:ubiquinol-cytochrome c reductase cytochrome b subunit